MDDVSTRKIERLSCHDEYGYENEFYRKTMKYVYISPM